MLFMLCSTLAVYRLSRCTLYWNLFNFFIFFTIIISKLINAMNKITKLKKKIVIEYENKNITLIKVL